MPDPSTTNHLDAYASVTLFEQRAHAIQSSFAVDVSNRGTIAEICSRLDGLPLAIELAAARVNVFSPAEILTRLTDRFALLTGHLRDAPPRLRSLRDAIGWSYELLSKQEQEMHSRLAVFVGGFSLEAANFVAKHSSDLADEWDTSGVIAMFIDQSLVERVDGAGGTRFQMLETIREYGLARLAAQGKLDAAQDSHAAFYQQMAVRAEAGLKGPDQAHWLRRLEDEHGNLREAVSWLTAAGRVPEGIELIDNIEHFMHVRSHFTEWKHLLDGWFAMPELRDRTRTRALALFADGFSTVSLGAPVTAIRSLEEALDLFREHGDTKHVVLSLNVLSFAYRTAGDLERARIAHRECMAMARKVGDARDQGLALLSRSNICRQAGNLSSARLHLEESLAVARPAGDTWVIGLAHGMLGRLALDLGEDLHVAQRLLTESLIIQETLGDRRSPPVGHADLALIARIQGDLDTAESHLQSGLLIALETGQQNFEAVAHLDLGVVARLRNDLERSLRELRQAARLLWPAHYVPNIVECLQAFAALALASGDALAAARFLGGADALLRGTELPRYFIQTAKEPADLAGTIRGKLGQQAFDHACAEGGRWSEDDAVAAAPAFNLPAGQTDQPVRAGPTHRLSPRELEVLRLMSNGLSNQQIADELFLSRRTVTSHVTSILGKLNLSSRTAAVSFAIRGGIA